MDGKKVFYEVGSLGGSYLLYENAKNSLDKSKEVMDEIVNQFEQSGAENIEYSDKAITNFVFETSDLNEDWTALNTPLDFSSIPELFVAEGMTGLYTTLGAAGVGLISGALAGKYSSNEQLKGLIKTGRRLTEAYGLGRIIGARIGLQGLSEYTITNPSIETYNLIDYSGDNFVSAVDIEPLINQSIDKLSNYFWIGLGVGLGAELISELIEYKNNPKTPSKAVEDYQGRESLGTNQTTNWDNNDVDFEF